MLSLAYVYIEKQWKCSEMEWKNFFFSCVMLQYSKITKINLKSYFILFNDV